MLFEVPSGTCIWYGPFSVRPSHRASKHRTPFLLRNSQAPGRNSTQLSSQLLSYGCKKSKTHVVKVFDQH